MPFASSSLPPCRFLPQPVSTSFYSSLFLKGALQMLGVASCWLELPALTHLQRIWSSAPVYFKINLVLSLLAARSFCLSDVTLLTLSILDLSSDRLSTSFQLPGRPMIQPPAPLHPASTLLWFLCVISSQTSISTSAHTPVSPTSSTAPPVIPPTWAWARASPTCLLNFDNNFLLWSLCLGARFVVP